MGKLEEQSESLEETISAQRNQTETKAQNKLDEAGTKATDKGNKAKLASQVASQLKRENAAVDLDDDAAKRKKIIAEEKEEELSDEERAARNTARESKKEVCCKCGCQAG